MDISSQIVPAAVILIANLLGGRHESTRWQIVTNLFLLSAGASIVLMLFFVHNKIAVGYLLQIAAFSLITALSRDYEKVLRPLFSWNR